MSSTSLIVSRAASSVSASYQSVLHTRQGAMTLQKSIRGIHGISHSHLRPSHLSVSKGAFNVRRNLTSNMNSLIHSISVCGEFVRSMSVNACNSDIKTRALEGDSQAQVQLGFAILTNNSKDRATQSRAIQWFEKAAAQGHADAMYALGTCFKFGYGHFSRSLGDAFQWYSSAAARGHAEATREVALFHLHGAGGVLESAELASDYFIEAINLGSSEARKDLGLLYMKGVGVPKNEAEGFSHIQSAAEAGDTNAMMLLSTAFEKGLGVDRDVLRAIYWLEYCAISTNNTEAMFRAGNLLYQIASDEIEIDSAWRKAATTSTDSPKFQTGDADAVSVDAAYRRALRWFEKAAADEHVPSMTRLATLLLEPGQAYDAVTAVVWLRKACAAGDNEATYYLAQCLERGVGIPRDKSKAIEFYKACDCYSDAADALTKLEMEPAFAEPYEEPSDAIWAASSSAHHDIEYSGATHQFVANARISNSRVERATDQHYVVETTSSNSNGDYSTHSTTQQWRGKRWVNHSSLNSTLDRAADTARHTTASQAYYDYGASYGV